MALNYLDLVLPKRRRASEYASQIGSAEDLRRALRLFKKCMKGMGLPHISPQLLKRLGSARVDEIKRAQACLRFVSRFPDLAAEAGCTAAEWSYLLACDGALGQAQEAVGPLARDARRGRYLLLAALTEANHAIEEAVEEIGSDPTRSPRERDQVRLRFGRTR